jgi:hypothetical protein
MDFPRHFQASPVAKGRGNICAAGQSQGLRIGVVGFALTLGAAVALAKTGVATELRWLLALPFFVAVVGVAESLLQTCPFRAMRAVRDQGDGAEPIADPKERAELRARGKRLLFVSGVLAVAAAGLFAELPL